MTGRNNETKYEDDKTAATKMKEEMNSSKKADATRLDRNKRRHPAIAAPQNVLSTFRGSVKCSFFLVAPNQLPVA